MANEAGLKIVVGSDVSKALAGLNSVSAAAAKAGIITEQSFNEASVSAVTLANSLESTSQSFAEVAASSAALGRVNDALAATAQSALTTATALEGLGTEATGLTQAALAFQAFNNAAAQLPLRNIDAYRTGVQQLKSELATGFKPIVIAGVDATSIAKSGQAIENAFDQAGGAAIRLSNTMQSVSGAFDVVADSSAQLINAGSAIEATTNNALKAAVALQQLSNESEGLTRAAIAFQTLNANAGQLPLASIEAYRVRIQQLKADLAGGFKPIVIPGLDATAVTKAGQAVQGSFDIATASATRFGATLQGITGSFNNVANASASLARVDSELEEVTKSATEAGAAMRTIGVAAIPVGAITEYRKQVAALRDDLKAGFKPKIEVVGAAGFGTLSAEARNAIESIGALETKLSRLNSQLKISTDPVSIARLNKEIKITESSIASLKKYTDSSTSVFKQLTPGANSAALALTNVGRVAQDLPFGFVGIQNNLNPLLESFQRLKLETGSTSGALKALGSSLIGAGGIGLALSAISAAFLIYQNGIAGFNKKTKEAKVELEGFAAALQEANQQAGDELARLTILTTVAQDNTRSTKDRMAAVVALQKEMPETFAQLEKEKILNGDLKPVIEATTAAITERAKARAIESRLGTLAARDLDLDIKREEISKKILLAERELARAREAQKNTRGAAADVGFSTFGRESNLDDLKDELKAVNLEAIKTGEEILRLGQRIKNEDLSIDTSSNPKEKQARKEEDALLKLLKENLDGYQKQLAVTNRLREAGLLPIFRENDALELQLKILDTLNAIDAREVAIKIKPRLEIDAQLNELEISNAIGEAAKRLSLEPTIPIAPILQLKADTALTIPDNIIPDNAFDAVIKKMRAAGALAAAEIGDIGGTISEAILDSLANTGEAIGQGFGDLLSGLGGASLVSGFANVLADLLTTIGKMLIKTGVEILGLQKLVLKIASTPAGAAAAIAGGIAAIALAQLLKNAVKDVKPRPFATGGLVNSPTLGLIGEAGPEVVLPLDRIPGLLNSVGTGNINLTGRLAISGRELVAFINREDRAYTRING